MKCFMPWRTKCAAESNNGARRFGNESVLRYHRTSVSVALGVVIIAVVVAGWTYSSCTVPRRGPQNIQEAIGIAQNSGLYWGSDERDCVPVYYLVMSEFPVTRERAGDLRMNDPGHPGWVGTVRLYSPWQSMLPNYDPACSAVWGEFFIYGDPRLVKRLIQ